MKSGYIKQIDKKEPRASAEGVIFLKKKHGLGELQAKAEASGLAVDQRFQKPHEFDVSDGGRMIAFIEDGSKVVLERDASDSSKKKLFDFVNSLL